MPRLKRETTRENKAHIEKAALRCFLTSGFHGVSVRDIANKAEVSLGNLYNYFPDKLSIFKGLLKEQSNLFLSPENEVIQYFLDNNFPDDVERLARLIKENVERFPDYFKLMYVDVVEFDGRHIRELFSHLDSKFTKVMGKRFKEIGQLGWDKTINPVFALITIYMSFYQYFILTKLFGAKNIYGKKTDDEVSAELINLFKIGMATARGKGHG